MPASTEREREGRREPASGGGRLGLSERALCGLSEAAAAELSFALIEAGQPEEAWEVLRLSSRQELLPQIAQKACASRRIECEGFAELGARAARWAIERWGAERSEGADAARLGEALSEALVVRNPAFLAKVEQEAGVELLEGLARRGEMFANGMTLANARRLSWAFDALDERFERACIERDLRGPQMLLGRAGACAGGEKAQDSSPAPREGERRRFGGFGLLGLATGCPEPFKRAIEIVGAMGFDVERELSRRAERRSYGGVEFAPHNCMSAALVARNEANARLIMSAAPGISPEREMRELMELMGPMERSECPERERLRLDFERARALACALEIERSAGGGRGGSGKRSRSL